MRQAGWRHVLPVVALHPPALTAMLKAKRQTFNILAIAQSGRLQYEAVLLAASLRAMDPDFPGRLFLAEPSGPLWPNDPVIHDTATRALLESLGAEFIRFENKVFGASYPYGNKIEALAALPDEPFLFLDTDTLILAPMSGLTFDFTRPSASMRREGTWPQIELYGPSYAQIWGSLCDRFGLDYNSTLDLTHPAEYWQRHLYFNAGWFFHQSPHAFGTRFLRYATDIRDNPPPELVCQELNPWLDQIALPMVIHSFGGGRPGPALAGLDGAVTCHYRTLSLLYARENYRVVEVIEQIAAPNPIKKVIKDYEPFRRVIYQGKGAEARELFDRGDLPRREQMIRNAIKREGLWFR